MATWAWRELGRVRKGSDEGGQQVAECEEAMWGQGVEGEVAIRAGTGE